MYLGAKELQIILPRRLKTTYEMSVLSLAWKQLSLEIARPLTKKDERSSESLLTFSADLWAKSGSRGLLQDLSKVAL